MKSKNTYILLFVSLLIAGAFYTYFARNSKIIQPHATNTPLVVTNTAGTISSNQDGTKQYSNFTYGISFPFKSTYHIGDDNLPKGTLQLFNYDESIFNRGWGNHENKIETFVISSYTPEDNSDNSIKERTVTETSVAGASAARIDIVDGNGLKIRSYSIPLRKVPGKYFYITIYGDESNFEDLDKIVEEFSFI